MVQGATAVERLTIYLLIGWFVRMIREESQILAWHRFPIWFAKVMEKLTNSWNTRIAAQTTQGKEISPTIRFKKGPPQGDAL